jgi:hypothetical protein
MSTDGGGVFSAALRAGEQTRTVCLLTSKRSELPSTYGARVL